jgi:NitT/TauT family transport system permease protein
VLGLAIVLAGWWGYAVAFDVNPVLLPTPPEVLDELIRLRERLFEQARVTLIEIVVGFVATAVIGIVVGTVIAHSRLVDMMVSPWLVALNAAPKVAFAPLLLVWLGHGISPRIAMVILIAFFPVILSTYAGLTSTPSDLVELARSMNSSRWRTFRKLRLPYAVPQIFVGLKVAMPLAAVGAVVGELNGGRTGLGYVIRAASNSGNTALAFAAIVVVSALGILLYYALSATERLVLPWVRATTA